MITLLEVFLLIVLFVINFTLVIRKKYRARARVLM